MARRRAIRSAPRSTSSSWITMPGYVVTNITPVFCAHGGKATPVPPAARVQIMGTATITTGYLYTIAGCGFPAMAPGSPPCVMGAFTAGALRVKSMGLPMIVLPSPSTSAPNGLPMIPVPAGQMRVRAT